MTLSPTFGDILRRQRVAAGLTQEELAERAGLSVRAISDLERGARHVPRRGTLQLLLDALELSATEQATLEAAARRLEGALAPAGGDPLDQILAAQPTPFLGRERELAAVGELLQRPEVRLLSLIGPGGMGKTRLALQAAATVRDAFPDGVYAVFLASLADPDLVLPAIAKAVGVREAGASALRETLHDYLGSQRLLLVLDNFEHVLPARSAVAELLDTCPRLTALITSRAVLRLARERTFDMPPLPAPDPDLLPDLAAVGDYDAVRLFCDRAQAVKAGFALTAENAPAIVQICHRLDGLPLALELAAARVRFLPPRALLAQLSRRLALLTSGPLDRPARHQTLRAAIDWSYLLLDESEQKLFARLAVFAGGGTLEAVEAVCDQAGDLPREALDLLGSLVEKSLVTVEEATGDDEPRFGMLETIREYALERLTSSDDAAAMWRQHAAYYLRLAEEAESHLVGPAQVEWLARLDRELDNLRAVLSRAAEGGEDDLGLRLAAALWRFWYARGHLGEGRCWLEGFLARARSHPPANGSPFAPPTVKALLWSAALAMDQGDYRRGINLGEEGLALSRQGADHGGVAFALNVLGNVAHYQGDDARAELLFTEGLALFRELDDRWGVGLSLNNLGMVARSQGDNERAAIVYQESLGLERKLGDLWSVAIVLDNLGELASEQGQAMALLGESLALRRELGDTRGIADSLSALAQIAWQRGDTDEAMSLFGEALTLYRKVGDKWRGAVCLEGVAAAARLRGQIAQAARLWAAATALRAAIGHPLSPVDRAVQEQGVAAARQALGDEAFAAAWATGSMVSWEEIGREIVKVVEHEEKMVP